MRQRPVEASWQRNRARAGTHAISVCSSFLTLRQTMNAKFVKPAAIGLGLAAEGERFGWHRFRHSLSTWANETTKDITISQTMLRHAKPDTTAIYTHGNFGKALDAQRVYMEQLLKMKPASESTQ